MRKKRVVLSLGGSLIISNGGIDIDFLKKFSGFVRKKIAKNCWQFFIVVGGGATAKHYQEAAKKILGQLSEEDIDWIGIYSTHLNSHLIQRIFADVAYSKIIDDYGDIDKRIKEAVVLAAGGKPGWSTDYDAVLLAQKYGLDRVINLTNVEMVYDKDPKKFADAKPIKKIGWDELLRIVGKEWEPGMRVPFDPIAAKLAKKIGLRVINCDGRDLKNLDNIIEGKRFKGTVIE